MTRRLVIFLLSVYFLAAAMQAAETNSSTLAGFQASPFFEEQILTFTNDLGVRVQINAPSAAEFADKKSVRLIFFGLPNGNTIEQTVGKKISPGDDWHFNIQHIGAQTRFLRRMLSNEVVIVAYLENNLKSWPAWRKTAMSRLSLITWRAAVGPSRI